MTAPSAAALDWCERHAIDPDVLDRYGVVERGGYLVIPNGRMVSFNGTRPKVKQPGASRWRCGGRTAIPVTATVR